jgi:hypothetical protein
MPSRRHVGKSHRFGQCLLVRRGESIRILRETGRVKSAWRRLLLLGAAVALFGGAAPASSGADGREMLHSPWLGLRFVQSGEEARLSARDLLTTEVRLRRRPFLLLLPRRGKDDVYRITAWTDASIFGLAPVGRAPEMDDGDNYFGPGTGIADTSAGSGTLFLDDRAHNHLAGLRLGPDPDRHQVYYSTVFAQRVATPIERLDAPLYLVAFHDEDRDGVMEHGEYEFLILRFSR